MHKKVFKQLLGLYFPAVYYLQCPTGFFPRAVYELRQLDAADALFEKHILTLDVYAINSTEAIDDAIDMLIDDLGKAEYVTGGFYYKFFYQNDRQTLPDTEKQIRRIRLTFEVRIFKRSDE